MIQVELARHECGDEIAALAEAYNRAWGQAVYLGSEVRLHGEFLPGVSGVTPEGAAEATARLEQELRAAAKKLVAAVEGLPSLRTGWLPPSARWDAEDAED